MTVIEALEAADNARKTQYAADFMLRKTAILLAKRLKVAEINHTTLCQLKK